MLPRCLSAVSRATIRISVLRPLSGPGAEERSHKPRWAAISCSDPNLGAPGGRGSQLSAVRTAAAPHSAVRLPVGPRRATSGRSICRATLPHGHGSSTAALRKRAPGIPRCSTLSARMLLVAGDEGNAYPPTTVYSMGLGGPHGRRSPAIGQELALRVGPQPSHGVTDISFELPSSESRKRVLARWEPKENASASC